MSIFRFPVDLSDLPRVDPSRRLELNLQELEHEGQDSLLSNADSENNGEEKKWSQLTRYLKFIVGKIAADSAYENANQEWEELGRVIDRLLFILFLILYIFTASALLSYSKVNS